MAEPGVLSTVNLRLQEWAYVDGRWYRLRDVAGGSVILGIAILTGSSSLFGWANVS